MVQLAWPIIVFQLLQVTYNLVDTLWLGRLSANAVGAISLAFPLVFLLIAVAGGFTTAGSILVAQYTGANSERSAGLFAGQTFAFVTVLAFVLGVIGYFYTGPMLGLLPSQAETGQQVVPLAAEYMRIFFLGLPFLFGFYVFEALMRGSGNTRAPMGIMFISVVVNVVIDPFLIFGWWEVPALGVQGAALATVFSRGLATVLGLFVLFRTGAGPSVRLEHLRINLENVREIVRLGMPTSLEQSANALAMVVLTAMIVSFAPPVIAAYGLGNRLISLVFLPALGLSRATETIVGQNLGADQPERAERAVRLTAGIAAGAMVLVAVLAAVFARPINAAFLGEGVPGAAETIALATDYLRIRSVEFAFIGVMQIVLGAFRGAGNTTTSMAFSWLNLWGVRVPAVYLLTFPAGLGPLGIWIGMSLGHIVGAILAGGWFLRGSWTRSVIDEETMSQRVTTGSEN